ncbi:MAG TPA: hypothetical protein ENI76_05350 [Ignavibacteria bacterium]|nr:hypothetical protein [Ignavibacteria bacterium]
MAKLNIKKFRSFLDFQLNILKTSNLITRISGTIYVLSVLDSRVKSKEIKLDKETEEVLGTFNVKDKEMEQIYEMGFIALFANFEFFMFDFLKELFLKFPNSLSKDLKINLGELSSLTSVEQIMEYIIDRTAIQKSYSIEKWAGVLQTFGIEVFLNKTEKKTMQNLNRIRNILMHSGGKIDSKSKQMLIEKFEIKSNEIRLGEDLMFNREKSFEILMKYFEKTIIANLEKI